MIDGKKKSNFIQDKSVPDTHFFDTFGNGVNRKISKPDLFKQIRDEAQTFIYQTVDELKQANLEADPDNPIYVRVAENNFYLYRITSLEPGPNDIALDNGATATFQQERIPSADEIEYSGDIPEDNVGSALDYVAGQISERVTSLPDITSLSSLNTASLVDGQAFDLGELAPGSGEGAARLTWLSGHPKSLHDGIFYISPTVPAPADFDSESDLDDYKNRVGETAPGTNGVFRVEREITKKSDGFMDASDTSGVPVPSIIADNEVFVDNLRQWNFHTPGAIVGDHNFDLPDDLFRLSEASRSLDQPIGPLNRVLFVGDSLTAYIASDGSYTMQVSKKLQAIKGGIREVGYVAAEPVGISAKQQFFGMSINQSGFTYFSDGTIPYTDVRRNYSPDGKGATISGATGAELYYWVVNSSNTVRYTRYRIYYLQQPGGGTFDIRNRGASLNPIDTDGALGLQTATFDFVPMGSPLNKDIRIENVTGDVTIYGVELIDDDLNSGYSWDIVAISGGALAELMQLDYTGIRGLAQNRDFDTVVINIGTNDSTQGRTTSQFETSLTNYLNRIQTELPDVKVCIVTPNNMQFTNFTGSTRALYENTRRAFCRANNYMYVDLPSEVGNFNYFAMMGWMRDGTHPNILGQNVIGMKMAEKLIANMTPEVSNPPDHEFIADTGVQAYGDFHADGGTLTVLNETGCTITRVSTGMYDVAFPKGLVDANYTISALPPASNRALYTSSRTASGFRVGVTNLDNVAVDVASANPLSFAVLGRKVPRL